MRVIFHDETIVSIDCGNCSRGYDPPAGRVLLYSNKADVEEVTITGMEVEHGKETTYRTVNNYRIDEDRLFITSTEALKKANALHANYVEEQKSRVYKKEKASKTWARNATYHRNLIKRAHKDIEYHTAKLNAANLKKKASKP